MKSISLTLIGIFLSVSVFLISILFEIDTFEILIKELHYLEKYEIDEMFIPFFIFSIFFIMDQLRYRKIQQIEHEKVKIYRAMLSSTHHILNNFMNQMLLFKVEAKKTPDFSPEILILYDEIIKDAKAQIEALGSISTIDDDNINNSVKP